MISKPIYQPSGKAAEYGDYAINIYTGCRRLKRTYYIKQSLREEISKGISDNE
jgi:hypothetical protein